ncbi:MAG TPA: universal stress protein [Steroidobacteraceae bacterium]|nr:universal stress protein [Steroidobacteraceae bacterium]
MTAAASTGPSRISRILVGTDYSPAAHRAVSRAGQLARQLGASLQLVHAQPDWNLFSRSSAVTTAHYAAILHHADATLRAELSHLREAFGLNVHGENRIGRASEVLIRAVAESAPDVMVIGARGEHEVAGLAPYLGGTALKMIVLAPCPVLLVRAAGEAPYRSCLAAVECADVPPRSLVRWAKALLSEGECHALHVFEVPYAARIRAQGVTPALLEAWGEGRRREVGRILTDMAGVESDARVRVSAHVVAGEPVPGILAEIEARHPDFVVLGKHRRTARNGSGSSLGSVAQRIAWHGSGDLLVVP